MAEESKIGWLHYIAPDGALVLGHTVNAWWGCKEVSPECANCYAKTWAKFTGRPELWEGERWIRVEAAIRELERYARDCDRDGHPRRIFLQSMSDIFEDHPALVEPRKVLFGALERIGPRVTPLILSKRAEDAAAHAKESGWLPWAWAMMTAGTRRSLTLRAPYLRQIPAPVRGLSMEPLLEAVSVFSDDEATDPRVAPGNDVEGVSYESELGREHDINTAPWVDWLIVGGESGAKARPMDIAWVRALVAEGQAAEVPVFVKQLGSIWAREAHAKNKKGEDPAEWPEDLRVQQSPTVGMEVPCAG